MSVFSQQKTIVPKKGTIVFQSTDVVSDKKLFEKSFEQFKSYIVSAINDEQTGNDLYKTYADEKNLQMIEDTFNAFFPFDNKKTIKYFQKFRDNIIDGYETINEEVVASRTINKNTGATDDILKDFEYYSKDKILKIQEFPNQIKMIHGYKSFKVVYMLQENKAVISENLSNGYIHYREIWVTTDIKCEYHPVIHDKLILQKYYPLEINEYFNVLKGYFKKYKLIHLDFEE